MQKTQIFVRSHLNEMLMADKKNADFIKDLIFFEQSLENKDDAYTWCSTGGSCVQAPGAASPCVT